MWQAVGFDLDNTLYDQGQHLRSFFRAASQWLASENRIDRHCAEKCFLSTWESRTMAYPLLFDEVLHTLGLWQRSRVLELVSQYRNHRCRLSCYSGVKSMLAPLARRVPLFLITDGHKRLQLFKVDQLGLARYFKTLIFTDDFGPDGQKPAPRPFAEASLQLGLRPSDCLFVGDDPDRDVAGAYLAGMGTARVLTGPYRHRLCLLDPDYTIGDLHTLGRILRADFFDDDVSNSSGGVYAHNPSPARDWQLKVRRRFVHYP